MNQSQGCKKRQKFAPPQSRKQWMQPDMHLPLRNPGISVSELLDGVVWADSDATARRKSPNLGLDGSLLAMRIQPGPILMVHLLNMIDEPVAQEVQQMKIQRNLAALVARGVVLHLLY